MNKLNPLWENVRSCLAIADDGRAALQRLGARNSATYELRDLDTDKATGKSFTSPGLTWPPVQTGGVEDESLTRGKAADISRDRSRVAMLDHDGRVHLIDAATGQTVGSPLEHPTEGGIGPIRAVSFCPQNKHV